MYEVNANGNRHYTSGSAASVARVAAKWRKDGHSPKAYAKVTAAGMVAIREVPVTTVKLTAAALKAAS
jgi:hypothetical protein